MSRDGMYPKMCSKPWEDKDETTEENKENADDRLPSRPKKPRPMRWFQRLFKNPQVLLVNASVHPVVVLIAYRPITEKFAINVTAGVPSANTNLSSSVEYEMERNEAKPQIICLTGHKGARPFEQVEVEDGTYNVYVTVYTEIEGSLYKFDANRLIKNIHKNNCIQIERNELSGTGILDADAEARPLN